MKNFPLLFGYRDLIVGNGFVAGVACDGRALLVEEDGETWMYGVNPGGLAGTGVDHGAANKNFRETYRAVLFDLAAEAKNFAAFEAAVRSFFAETNRPTEAEWLQAVQDVRAGRCEADWLEKKSADTERGVQVVLIEELAPEVNQIDEQEALATPPPQKKVA